MERIPNGRYTKEFREEAVKMVTDGGLSVGDIKASIFAEINLGALAEGCQDGEAWRDRQGSASADRD